ncbi:MAG: hypothetical protein U5L09_08755 [Bacteroidales bacterium]|nr:hypothetical protein [Bacteroidales bacterium]
MKILFFISLYSHGRGGHVYSLNHISQKIAEVHDVKIISIGPGQKDIIQTNPYFIRHIEFNGLNISDLRKILQNERRIFQPDIYHFFDEGSYNIIRTIISSKKNKMVLNHCGGPNPNFFPHIHNLILFSSENLSWFQAQKNIITQIFI